LGYVIARALLFLARSNLPLGGRLLRRFAPRHDIYNLLPVSAYYFKAALKGFYGKAGKGG
jgi:hypothetical protein